MSDATNMPSFQANMATKHGPKYSINHTQNTVWRWGRSQNSSLSTLA